MKKASRKARYVVIACEGYTEQSYFKELKKREKKRGVEVKFFCVEGEQKPIAFLEKAWAFYYENACDFRELNKEKMEIHEDDTIWCIYDVDNKTAGDVTLFEGYASQIGIEVVRSDPSFELWFYLHFADVQIHEKYSQDAMEKQLKLKWRDYKKADSSGATMGYLDLLSSTEILAIDRAKNLRRKHEEAASLPTERPRTYVDIIVEKMKG